MNKSVIITAIVTLILGIGIGFLLFGRSSGDAAMDTHDHELEATTTAESKTIWTCSMHPQIRQNEPGDCPLCGMDLIPLEAGNSDNPIQLTMTADAVKLANIQTTIIGQVGAGNTASLEENGGKELLLAGKVKMNETLSSTQTAHVGGRIEKLYVNSEGENIRKGQKIASVYSPELVAAQKELFEAKKLQNRLPALYEAAKNKLQLWKIPVSTIQEIEQRGVVKTEIDIFADVDGTVMRKMVNLGDHIKAGSPMFEVMNLSKVWVLFDIYEKDLQWIRKGDVIEFNVAAMPEKTFKAPITFIDPFIDPQTRVATVRVEASSNGGKLKPDMFAKGILKTNPLPIAATSKKGGTPLTIPKTAVLWTGKESVVYIKNQEMDIPTFEYRVIKLGVSLGDAYVVESGLEAGAEVVTNGAFKIDASAQLSNKASMMNKQVAIKNEAMAKEDMAVKIPNYHSKTPKAFKLQLGNTASAYLQLKDALVATDFEAANLASMALKQAMEKTDMMLLKGEVHTYWMEQLKPLNVHLDLLQKAKGVEDQRKQFSNVSDLLTVMVKAFGIDGTDLYVQFCPMGFDNIGAYWLSEVAQIQNPYFGDKMMKCGSVTDTLKAD
ncbi:MAG: efflux RND transporter periplasmic adaptor subunit [Chitinophagales bacterium]